jgi:hypothetical protein
MRSKSRHLLLALGLVALLPVVCPSARATYTATLNEVGTNVVGTGSGSLDITAFGIPGNFGGGSVENPSSALLLLGTTSPPGALIDGYSGISGPTSFGSGSGVNADIGGGSVVGVNGNFSVLFVPKGYVSGTPLTTSTDTWSNASFASLGITPGTYTWTWGSGMSADSFILQIGPASPTNGNGVPDSGTAIALMLGSVGTLITFRQKFVVSS